MALSKNLVGQKVRVTQEEGCGGPWAVLTESGSSLTKVTTIGAASYGDYADVTEDLASFRLGPEAQVDGFPLVLAKNGECKNA